MPRRLIFTSRALVAAELVLQDLAEQEKSDTTKHSLGEKVGRYSASDNVAGNNRFILVLFHGRERAEDENKESN